MSNIKTTDYVEGLVDNLEKNTETIQSGLSTLKTEVEEIKGSLGNITIKDNSITEAKYCDNSITNTKYKDKSITPIKTDFFGYKDIMAQENIDIGTINSVGEIDASANGYTSDYIPVKEGETIYIPGKITYLAYYDINKTSLTSALPRLSNLNNAEIKIPTNVDMVKYIRISWSSNEDSEYYRTSDDIKIYKTDAIKLLKKFEDNSLNASVIKDLNRSILNILGDNNVYLELMSDYKTLCIYMKTKEKNSYLQYSFKKMTATYDASNSSSNYDIWRLGGVGVYTKNSDGTFSKSYDDTLIDEASEWECAIKETGKTDFVGGSTHGDEFLDSIVFIVDGVVYTDVYLLNEVVCKELRIIRKSKLYRANENSSTHIADHFVDYLFKNNEITIDNRVDWKVGTNCGISYLCMLGARRLNNEVQITNKGIKQGDGKILDVSTEGHTNTSTTKRCTKAYLWNDGTNGGLNVSMSVEILDNNFFPNFNFKFDNSAEYNKFYFDQCGTNFDVKKGDIWYNKALYKIDYFGKYFWR